MKHLNLQDVPSDVRPMALGLESIAFQNSKYFDELVSLVRQAREGSITLPALCNQVEISTLKHKGILVEMETIPGMHNGYIYPEWLTATNPISGQGFNINSYMSEPNFDKVKKRLVGAVDTKNAKVSGDFSKIRHTMGIGAPFILEDFLSVEGAASVILHEIGHAFTFIQFSMQMMLHNVAMAQASRNLAKAETYEQIQYTLTQVARDMNISETDFIVEKKLGTDKVKHLEYLASAISTSLNNALRADVSKGFTQDACEELADIFAARHGAEKATMEVRHMYSSYSIDLFSGCIGNFATLLGATAGGVILTGTLVKAGSAVAAPFAPLIALCVVTFLYCAYVVKSDLEPITELTGVTEGFTQIRRMQQQLIERLKNDQGSNGKANAKLVEYVMDGMAYGDSLLASVKKREPYLIALMGYLLVDRRDARRTREYQNRLEALASNNLFLSAARLHTV